MMIFIPTVILGIFNVMCCQIFSLSDRMAALGFSFMGYMEIFRQLRAELPAVKKLTFAEKFIMSFLVIGLVPSLRGHGEDCPEPTHHLEDMMSNASPDLNATLHSPSQEVSEPAPDDATPSCIFYFDEPELEYFFSTMILLIIPILLMTYKIFATWRLWNKHRIFMLGEDGEESRCCGCCLRRPHRDHHVGPQKEKKKSWDPDKDRSWRINEHAKGFL